MSIGPALAMSGTLPNKDAPIIIIQAAMTT